MNELPIVILSKQLKYSLVNDKVKTLEKAIQLLPKLTENQQNKKKIIQKLATKYSQIKSNVASQFKRIANKQSDIKGESTQQIIKNIVKVPTPFYQFLLNKTICQIFGPKGSGKTSLLLHLAEEFAQAYKNYKKQTRVVILNCVSGITEKRLQKLKAFKESGMTIQCIDIPSVEDIVKIIVRVKDELSADPRKKVFIGIDMMVLLLMTRQKAKPFVVRIFKAAAEMVQKHTCVLFFTNLVQHKFQLGTEELYNHASYHCQSTAQYLTHKLYVERPDKTSAGRFKLTNIKGNKIQAFFQIEANGISQLNAYRVQ